MPKCRFARLVIAGTLLLASAYPASPAQHRSTMKIIIETIPYKSMRYETAGDYWRDPDGTLHIVVAEMADKRYEQLVALHELVELMLCEDRGISLESVDAFDMGPGKDLDEPGDDPRAPYHKEHMFASHIEREAAREMDVNWSVYEEAVDRLGE